MTDAQFIVIVILLVVSLALLIILIRKTTKADTTVLLPRLEAFERTQDRTERAVREEVASTRDAQIKTGREQRLELADAFKHFGDSVMQRMMDVTKMQNGQLDTFSEQLAGFAKASSERLDAIRTESANGARQLREEVVQTLTALAETITKTIGELSTVQKGQLDGFSGQLGAFATGSGEKLDGIRAESASGARLLREEVVATLGSISETMTKTIKDLSSAEKTQLEAFSTEIALLTKSSGEKLDGIRAESALGAKQLREEVVATLNGITESTTKTMGELANLQKIQLDAMSSVIGNLSESNEKKLEAVRVTVETKLQSLQADNAKQIDQMRQTVDEKLQGTLEKRLGESFKQVSERLELVHKGLGEMQSLATGVGDLKKVLTNVKTRGTWGEVQLAALLEQVLNPDQYAPNVAPKDGGERVEFAIKLPGQGADNEVVWLPIDAKFPVEDYQRLIDAQERACCGRTNIDHLCRLNIDQGLLLT